MVALNRGKTYRSWAGYPHSKEPPQIQPIQWRHELPPLDTIGKTVLPYGYGRSYGDSCLNDSGVLIDPTFMQQFIAFDDEKGILCCEAGASFEQILQFAVPRGWFIAGTPGTKFVSVGGAIANDVHGKGHHTDGTFGRHVRKFELLRSNGEQLICSSEENSDLFRATIGGLGLTGVILWAEIQLKPIKSPFIDAEELRFANLNEFFEIALESHGYEYVVSWVDCTARGESLGRGIFTRGNHYDPPLGFEPPSDKRKFAVPFDVPAINPLTVRVFNELYYQKSWKKQARHIIHYEPFFYPLDGIHQWYRLYGKRGFLQWQCVVPYRQDDFTALKRIMQEIAYSGQASFMTVLKLFGDIESPGMLSFPREGVTLAVDFAVNDKAFHLCERLDEIVREYNGAIYPAKDARMSPETFAVSFPNWREFAQYIDPKFSSNFWRRVTVGL